VEGRGRGGTPGRGGRGNGGVNGFNAIEGGGEVKRGGGLRGSEGGPVMAQAAGGVGSVAELGRSRR
jgi:hypothetical protein